jgi:cytochrome c oxidase assembly protein subunit 11
MAKHRRRNGLTAGLLLGLVAVMIGLAAASAPLYRLFCQATGYGGTTQRASAAPQSGVADRLVTVRFDANTAIDLGWKFEPLQRSVVVHPGEEQIVAYRAENLTREPLTGTATFNVTPAKTGIYFDKLQCFCFTRQHLEPGESAELAVKFFVDPAIADDPNTRDVDAITLSYTMFRAKPDASDPVRSSALPVPSAATN